MTRTGVVGGTLRPQLGLHRAVAEEHHFRQWQALSELLFSSPESSRTLIPVNLNKSTREYFIVLPGTYHCLKPSRDLLVATQVRSSTGEFDVQGP